MKYQTGASFFEERSPEDVERFVEKNFDISEQVTHLLERKGMSQKDLAQAIGKAESEISRWLCGTHNLTLRSIAKMEAALGEDIITTPLKQESAKEVIRYVYMHTKVYVPAVRSGLSLQFVPTIEMDEQGEQAEDLKVVA
jgi:transcriptional regulator with XRE-family HTH domain